MGIMTELFLAESADAVKARGEPPEEAELLLGGLTSLQFETLWAILVDEKWSSKKHKLSSVIENEGNWTFELPAAFVDALARSTSGDIARAAPLWTETEEMGAMGAGPDEVAPSIRQLAELARTARTSGKNVFLWVSL